MNSHIFLGNNSPHGFWSYYDDRLADIGRVYVLKGSPASGKSTLVKKVGAEAEKRGFRTEYWHCSGDSSSLDGVYVPACDFAVVDGTAPHVVEPTLPVAKERLIALGDFISADVLTAHLDEIKKLLIDKKRCFSCAYLHLKAYSCETEVADTKISPSLDRRSLRRLAAEEASRTNFPERQIARQFFRAVTPDGVVVFPEVFEGHLTTVLQSARPLTAQVFLEELTRGERGYAAYYSPFAPDRMEAVTIGGRSYLTAEAARALSLVSERTLNLDGTDGEFACSSLIAAKCLDSAIEELARAKANHLAVEEFYKAAIDFDALNARTDALIAEIFA